MTHKFTKCFFALLIAIGLAFTAGYATAQSSVSGSISGTVTDATGAVIPGATVTVTNTDRGQDIRVLKTDSAGFYTADSLPLGAYKITFESGNFKTEVVSGLVLHAADALTVNRKLSPGGANEVVTVDAGTAQLVDLEDATSSGLINSTQINEMPLITRNYEVLMNLQPGVSFGGATDDLTRGPAGLSGSSSTVAFSVNGGRTTSNSWTIDGADNLDRGANLTLYTYPSPDAIAEFKTLRGQYSAQFGRNASGQVDVVTKSGTNSLHGSAYEFVRNNYFDANGYANDFLGAPIPPYRYNDFGFEVGGPVLIPRIYNGKNKTFFMVSEEWQRIINVLSQATATVPLASERTGDFTQSYQHVGGAWTQAPVTVCTAATTNTSTLTNTCTATGTNVTSMSSTAQAYLKDVFAKVPVPNSSYDIAHGFDPHTIFTNFKDVFNNLDTVVRIDQQFGQKLSIFYRYLHDTFPQILPQGQFTTVYIAGANTTSVVNPGTEQLAHATYVISPTLLLNVGYAYSNGNIVSTPSGFLASAQSPDVKPSLPYTNTVGLIPNLAISGMTTLNGSVAYVDHGTNHQIFGDITKVLHTHTLIAGYSYNHYQKLENNTTGTQGAFTFANDSQFYCSSKNPPPCIPAPASGDAGSTESQAFANFLTGNANGGFSQLSRDPVTDIKFALYEGFVQDNWKVKPRLTVNLGVRYSYYGQPWDANYLLSNFEPSKYSASAAPTIATTGLMCFSGTCNQAGSNAGLSTSPNPNADYNGINYINGMIFNGPSSLNNNQASPYGNKVGAAQNANFAPRFGFAFDLFGDGKTVLRGGYGWAFDNAEVSYYETTVFNNPPSVATYSVGQTLMDNPTGGSLSALTTNPGRIQAVPTNFQTPYVQQFSLDVQQALSPSFMFDVGYFGDHGTHLLGALEENQPVPGAWVGVVQPSNSGSACIDPDTGAQSFLNSTCDRVLNQIRPYLGYFAIDGLRTIFNSNYNSLQAKVTKRFKGSTYFDANYTWSRDLTNAQADYSGFIQNIYNINGDYGRAAVDRTQILNIDWVVEEPWFREQKNLTGRLLGGWELSGIYSVNSGLPLTISASSAYSPSYNLPGGVGSVYNSRTSTGYITDNAGIGVLGNTNAGLRADQIGNPNTGNGVKIHNKGYHQLWFYTGAFAAPNPANTSVPATAKRGTINGPGSQVLDLGVFRNFRVWNRLNFQFRAEALNAANHTNVQSVVTAIGFSPYLGEVTGYRDARIMQFAGKFTF